MKLCLGFAVLALLLVSAARAQLPGLPEGTSFKVNADGSYTVSAPDSKYMYRAAGQALP